MVVIGTHSGAFHADEACSIFMLRKLSEYADAEVIRTRDQAVLDTCDIVVDVGGIYNPDSHHYDHHQRSFAEDMSSLDSSFTAKLSSAGLVYRHFGRRVLATLLTESDHEIDAAAQDLLYTYMYRHFVHAVDCVDNGVAIASEPTYIESTSVASRVGRLNPRWNEKLTPEEVDARFAQAVSLVGEEFVAVMSGWVCSFLPARGIVAGAYFARHTVHPSGQIVVLPEVCPWKQHLDDLENEARASTEDEVAEVLYVVYPSESMRIQAVPGPTPFSQRKALPEGWRGLRDGALAEVSGVKDAVFVHAAGFIGAAQSLEGAMAMADYAVKC